MADNEEGVDIPLHGNEWEVPKNIDHEDCEEPTPRGNEWEVVSLTASAYAAAPGPRGNESIYQEKGTIVSEDEEAETSRALFMSGHFVFPPSDHENLPIGPLNIENPKGDKGVEDVVQMIEQKEGKSKQKQGEDWGIEGLNVPEEFPGIQLFDQKGDRKLSIHDSGFDEAVNLHGLNVDDKGQDVYGAANFSSFHSGTTLGGSAAFGETAIINELIEQSDHEEDSSSLISQSLESGKEEELDDSKLPCGAWWKRRVASLCAQAKDTNAFWSIFVTAAVMGLVLLGQRWQQERWQVLQQRWQLTLNDEKPGRILLRLKDVIIGGSRRGTYITASSTEL